MLAILFSLISFFGWAIGDFLSIFATKKLGSYSFAFWNNVIWFLIFIPFYPFFIKDLWHLSLLGFFIISVASILDLVGLVFFYEGLKTGPVSLVGTIGASFAALVVVFSLIFLKETITAIQIVSIIIIFIGLFLSTLDLQALKKGKLTLSKGIVFAFIAMICWGIGYTFIKIPIREIGWFWPNAFIGFMFPFFYLFIRFKKIRIVSPNQNKVFILLIICSLLYSIGGTAFNYALSKGLSSIVAPISAAYPALLVLLVFIFLKDKITKQQIFGIITTILGIVFLALYSA
jgi:drug/metabolite transporter (DMT)-like permease